MQNELNTLRRQYNNKLLNLKDDLDSMKRHYSLCLISLCLVIIINFIFVLSVQESLTCQTIWTTVSIGLLINCINNID